MPEISTARTFARNAQGAILRPIRPARQPVRSVYLDLFSISFAILFLELACIRWFGSAVMFLTFFTNLVLMACFLGMSVGLLTSRSRRNYVAWVIPMALLAVGLAEVTSWATAQHGALSIGVGGRGSPQ